MDKEFVRILYTVTFHWSFTVLWGGEVQKSSGFAELTKYLKTI